MKNYIIGYDPVSDTNSKAAILTEKDIIEITKNVFMDNKYYTPELEEFHMGFEYEWLHEDGDWIKATPTEINSKDFKEQLYGLRVKYLDREDIESLGYEDLGSLWFENKKNKTRIRKWKNTQIDIYTDWYSNEDNALRFRGSCKNKSEFKRLMKQLNIIT